MSYFRACDCWHYPCQHNPLDEKTITEVNARLDPWFKRVFWTLIIRLKIKYGTPNHTTKGDE
jgi:hypothetical protein